MSTSGGGASVPEPLDPRENPKVLTVEDLEKAALGKVDSSSPPGESGGGGGGKSIILIILVSLCLGSFENIREQAVSTSSWP